MPDRLLPVQLAHLVARKWRPQLGTKSVRVLE